jgi:hypothetical protein
MRNVLSLFLVLILSQVNAQISLERSYVGFFAPRDPNAPDRLNRWMIDLFHDDFREIPDPGIKTSPYSVSVNVTRFMELPLNKGSNFSIAIGLSFGSHNVHHNGFFETSFDTITAFKYTSLTPFPAGTSYRRNKISLNYFDIPVQIRFRTNKKNNFFFYPGFKAGYLFNDHTTFVDESGKYKHYNTYAMMRFRYGPMIHLGFNRLAFFGFYSMTPVLQKNRGDQFYSISLGLSITFF